MLSRNPSNVAYPLVNSIWKYGFELNMETCLNSTQICDLILGSVLSDFNKICTISTLLSSTAECKAV